MFVAEKVLLLLVISMTDQSWDLAEYYQKLIRSSEVHRAWRVPL